LQNIKQSSIEKVWPAKADAARIGSSTKVFTGVSYSSVAEVWAQQDIFKLWEKTISMGFLTIYSLPGGTMMLLCSAMANAFVKKKNC